MRCGEEAAVYSVSDEIIKSVFNLKMLEILEMSSSVLSP